MRIHKVQVANIPSQEPDTWHDGQDAWQASAGYAGRNHRGLPVPV